jgi:hypothetical protein
MLMSHFETVIRRLVHLPEYHHHVRYDTRLFHVTVKIFALAAAFADAANNLGFC